MKNFLTNLYTNIYLKYLKKYLPILCLVVWIFFTLLNPCMKAFFRDELWAWNIASDLSMTEIIKLMHYEGHTFLWYYILKPFTCFSFTYPWIVKYLNWTFCLSSVLLLWRFSPINNLIKILITFSMPFFAIYPVFARPYALTILLMFILVILYKKRFLRPILFSSIIFLTMNTCINGAIFASGISIIFLYDILKSIKSGESKSNYFIPVFIVICSYFMLVVQWLPFNSPCYVEQWDKFVLLKKFLFNGVNNELYKAAVCYLCLPLLVVSYYYLIKNVKQYRWVFLGLYSLIFHIIFYLTIYPGFNYHHCFMYVYIVMLYWLLKDNSDEFVKDKSAYNTFTALIFMLSVLFNSAFRPVMFDFTHEQIIKDSAMQIKEIVPAGSTIKMEMYCTLELFPYLKNDYKLVNKENVPIPSFESYSTLYGGGKIYNSEHIFKNNTKKYFLTRVENDNKNFKNKPYQILYGTYKLYDLNQ